MGDVQEFCHSCTDCNIMVQKLYEHLCGALGRSDLKVEFKITAPKPTDKVLIATPKHRSKGAKDPAVKFKELLRSSWLVENLPDDVVHQHVTRRKTGEPSLDANVLSLSSNAEATDKALEGLPNPDDYWLPPNDPRYKKVVQRREELNRVVSNTDTYLIASRVSKEALTKKLGYASAADKRAILEVCKENIPVTSRVDQGVQTGVVKVVKVEQSSESKDAEAIESRTDAAPEAHEVDEPMVDEDDAKAFDETPDTPLKIDHEGDSPEKFDPFARSDAVIDEAMDTLATPMDNMQGVTCDLCGESCMSTMFLRFHEEEAHKRDGFFHCDKCDLSFQRRNQMIDHVERHDGRVKHLCQHCGQGFVTRYDYMKHVNKQHSTPRAPDPSKVILCTECGFSTHRAQKLREHVLAKHTDEKRERCPLCPFATKLRSNLRIHVRKHHEEHFRTYFPEPHTLKCIYCPYRIFANNQYINHMKQEHRDRNSVALTRKAAIRQGLGGSVKVINEKEEPEVEPAVGMIAKEYALAFKDDGTAFVVGSC